MPDPKKPTPDPVVERRTEPRLSPVPYYSVEFTIGQKAPIYQFKLRDISSSGLCILVREDSAVLGYLEEGQVIQMAYRTLDMPGRRTQLTTQVRHIIKSEEARYKGHFLVGLAMLDGPQDTNRSRARE